MRRPEPAPLSPNKGAPSARPDRQPPTRFPSARPEPTTGVGMMPHAAPSAGLPPAAAAAFGVALRASPATVSVLPSTVNIGDVLSAGLLVEPPRRDLRPAPGRLRVDLRLRPLPGLRDRLRAVPIGPPHGLPRRDRHQ